jgi:hypothetical protein
LCEGEGLLRDFNSPGYYLTRLVISLTKILLFILKEITCQVKEKSNELYQHKTLERELNLRRLAE